MKTKGKAGSFMETTGTALAPLIDTLPRTFSGPLDKKFGKYPQMTGEDEPLETENGWTPAALA